MKKILFLSLIIITLVVCVLPCEAAEVEETVNITLQDKTGEKPFAETVTEYVKAYTSEIFCSLTFIGSLITAFLYKKGLLPTLSEGINKIYSIAKSSGERAEDMQKESADSINKFISDVLPILEKTKDLADYAEALHRESVGIKDELEREKAERENLTRVLDGQTDLLYGVFMSASLPEYQKEMLTEKYSFIKALIAERGKETESNAGVE
jgi:hypothetical protein